jgi:hypothetical protein
MWKDWLHILFVKPNSSSESSMGNFLFSGRSKDDIEGMAGRFKRHVEGLAGCFVCKTESAVRFFHR